MSYAVAMIALHILIFYWIKCMIKDLRHSDLEKKFQLEQQIRYLLIQNRELAAQNARLINKLADL